MQGVWKTSSLHCNIGDFNSSIRNTSGDFLYRMKDFASFFCNLLATLSDDQLTTPIGQGKKSNKKVIY
ncbi:hypothetical protein VNO77_06085 [Canavalia gladiata]|uniref:Uncharacterized protein n=1 Tax=Canavalia gladiata TaxID=3824 RepID=A0AAN9N4Q8_CANGL